MSEGWATNQQQPISGRSYNNSNYNNRGPRREGGMGGGSGGRPGGYQNGGGYAQRQNGYGQNNGHGGGYGGGHGGGYENRSFQNRPPRNNFGGPPRTGGSGGGGGGGGFNVVGNSLSAFEIDSNKVGMVIGRKGGKIREIQDNFQVHVKIGKHTFHHNP